MLEALAYRALYVTVRTRMQGLAQPGGALLGADVLRVRAAAPVLCRGAAYSLPRLARRRCCAV